jgi:DNA-binding CsgD family transcriptional regulator
MKSEHRSYPLEDSYGKIKTFLHKASADIKKIQFTNREIDIISSLAYGKTVSKRIAIDLGIRPDTVDTNIRNIGQRIGISGRSEIGEILRKTGISDLARTHYKILLTQLAFNKCLQGISALIKGVNVKCFLEYEDQQTSDLLKSSLEKDLRKANIEVTSDKLVPTFIISAPFLSKVVSSKNEDINEQKSLQKNLIIIKDKQFYYLSVLEFLKKLITDKKIDQIYDNFKKEYDEIWGSSPSSVAQIPQIQENIAQRKNLFKAWSTFAAIGFVIICLVCIGAFYMYTSKSQAIVRSKLPIPEKYAFLERPKLLKQIDNKLKTQQGIGTVALVGIGGAGKTTLAHHYASLQKASVVYELNAETKESLMSSFKKLADKLIGKRDKAQSDELKAQDKAALSQTSEDENLTLVKNRLKQQSNWFLIYDNVDSVSDIKDYRPDDTSTWGEGKVLITTRNGNIENPNYISPDQVIQIDKLTQEEALSLFCKIRFNSKPENLSKHMIDDTLNFLEDIPPYPLDISITAYYLKATNTTYSQYLEHLKEYDTQFESRQENILKKSGYEKTRYSIIRLSIEKLIATNKEFGKLFLFMCLLDSQNIPIELLQRYKNTSVVEDFIYNMKKYSLIIDTAIFNPNESHTISMHHTVQKLCLVLLRHYLNLNKNSSIIKEISTTFEKYLLEAVNKKDSNIEALIPHVEVFLSHSDLLRSLSIADASLVLGKIFSCLGQFKNAMQCYDRSFKIYNDELGAEHIKTAETILRLGDALRSLGHYNIAKNLIIKGVSIYKKNYQKNDINRGWSYILLGNAYSSLGLYKNALSYLEKGTKIYSAFYGDCHPETSNVKIIYGEALQQAGKNLEAATMIEQALPILEATYSRYHHLISHATSVLGGSYFELGDYNLASNTFFRRGIKIGMDYPGEVNKLTQFGRLYGLIDYNEGQGFLEFGQAGCIKLYGPEHIEIAKILVYWGQLHLFHHELKKAEQILNQALEIFNKNNHPDKYACLEAFGDLYKEKYNMGLKDNNGADSQPYKAKAIGSYQEALKILKEHFPSDSSHTKRVQEKLNNLSLLPHNNYVNLIN